MLVLDAVSPLERVKLSAELSAKVKLLSGDVGALQRVNASARVAAILRELGVGSVSKVEPAAPTKKIRNFGWDAVRLSELSMEDLQELRRQVEAEHANPFDEKSRYTENGQPSLYVYDKKGRWKLDKLAWAVTYKLQEKAAAVEAPSVDEQIKQLLNEYLELQRRKYAHTMKGDERGAEVAAQYALDDMRVQVRRNKETNGGEAMALEVLADEVAYSREKIEQLLKQAADSAREAAEPSNAPSAQLKSHVLTQYGKGLDAEEGYTYLAARQRKTGRGIFVVAGNLDRATFKSISAEAVAAGVSRDKYYVFGEMATYAGTGIDFTRLDSLPALPVSPEDRSISAPALEIVEHTTGKGKIIRGIVRTDLSHAEAKAIDEYTFKKNGGWFIREKHLDGYVLPAGGERQTPAPKPELTPEQQAQIEADRMADQQLREQQKRVEQVSKLRAAAESTIDKAEEELGRDRLTNTARRADMASSIRARHESARAIGKTMQNLADAIESGDAKHLAGINSRAAVELLQERLVQGMYEADRAANLSYSDQLRQKGRAPTEQDAQHAKFPFPQWGSAGTSLSKVLDAIKGKKGSVELAKKIRFSPGPDGEILRALKAMLPAKEFGYQIGWWNIEQVAKAERLRRMGINGDADLRAALVEYLQFREGARQEDPIKKAERAIIGQKVGIDFFPTPVATASRMADLARIGKGDRVLEPSAGNGNLADAAKSKGAEVDVLEISSQLRDILKAKGYNVVDHDFETFEPESKYDAVIMNPPFSSRKDAEHIQRAFGMLKPGGRLVAIAGEGVFIGSDAKAVQFRSWLDSHGAEVESLEKNTFQDKNLLATTGANGRLIVLTK